MIAAWVVSVAAVAAVVAGCGAGPRPAPTDVDPNLKRIAAAYTAKVDELHGREGETWHHGWVGNAMPNVFGAAMGQKGLCYQWQEEVWRGVGRTVGEVGWEGVGIAANVGRWTEHHVVAVYDPKRIGRGEILTRKPPRPVWVLDPWRTGRAEVYTLEEWLVRGTAERYSVGLEAFETVGEGEGKVGEVRR